MEGENIMNERLDGFYKSFNKLVANRDRLSLAQLQGEKFGDAYKAVVRRVLEGATWYARYYLASCADFPRHPKDTEGNKWMDKKIQAILAEEKAPGGLMEQCGAALIDRLSMTDFEQKVFEIYQRLEREAFAPYWRRHCHWTGEPGKRHIYNDVFFKFWWPEHGYWAYSDNTDRDYRFPPDIKEK